jgi:hypothetical protein
MECQNKTCSRAAVYRLEFYSNENPGKLMYTNSCRIHADTFIKDGYAWKKGFQLESMSKIESD